MLPSVFAHAVEGRPAVYIAGDLYTLLASGKETNGAYAAIDAIVPPGGGPPLHLHRREDEAFYIVEGTITFYADGQTTVAGPGTWLHARRDQPHRFANESGAPARILILTFPAGIEEYFWEVGRPVTDRSAPHPAPTADEISQLLSQAGKYGIEFVPQ